MLIIWGQRLYGKVDEVPGLFYVRTRFFHIYYIPLFPLQTFIVLAGSETGNGFKGKATSMSFKSVLFGWLRGGCVVGAIAGLIGAIINACQLGGADAEDALVGLIASAVLAVVCVFGYWLSTRLVRASYERALQLAEELGIPLDMIEEHFGGQPLSEVEPADPYDERLRD
jgi:hypothetical protein